MNNFYTVFKIYLITYRSALNEGNLIQVNFSHFKTKWKIGNATRTIVFKTMLSTLNLSRISTYLVLYKNIIQSSVVCWNDLVKNVLNCIHDNHRYLWLLRT